MKVALLFGSFNPIHEGHLAILRYLAEHFDPARLHLRVPLIPGYNDKGDQMKTEAALLNMGFTHIERFSYVVR